MWFPGFPVAVEPLWQFAQVPVAAAWSMRVTGDQAEVEWQLSQVVAEAI